METTEVERFTLRVPANLQIELKIMAARARRSLNNQIVAMLEEAVSHHISGKQKDEAAV